MHLGEATDEPRRIAVHGVEVRVVAPRAAVAVIALRQFPAQLPGPN
jgi:hypothetical protein